MRWLTQFLAVLVPIFMICLSYFIYVVVVTVPDPSDCYYIGAVTDQDHESRNPEKFEWYSTLRRVFVKFDAESQTYKFVPSFDLVYSSQISRKNRSMEFSALQIYDGKLYGFCDYTGIMFEMPDFLADHPRGNIEAIPRAVLQSGDGNVALPFKNEWVTLKDDRIIVGSIGKEWVVDKKEIHTMCEWVKHVHVNGEYVGITHVDFGTMYHKLRKAVGYEKPGYFLHEAVHWDEELHKWIFIPRKASKHVYEERVDQYQGSNLMIFSNTDGSDITWVELGPKESEWGFSAITKLPGTTHHYVGIKAKEITKGSESIKIRHITNTKDVGEYTTGSKMVVFDHTGKILSDWYDLGTMKFEGIEVLKSEC